MKPSVGASPINEFPAAGAPVDEGELVPTSTIRGLSSDDRSAGSSEEESIVGNPGLTSLVGNLRVDVSLSTCTGAGAPAGGGGMCPSVADDEAMDSAGVSEPSDVVETGDGPVGGRSSFRGVASTFVTGSVAAVGIPSASMAVGVTKPVSM